MHDRTTNRRLICQALGEFNQNASIRRIADFPERNNKAQPLDNIQIDLIVPKQLQQFVRGVIGIVNIHRASSGRE
jgi:hypothetical protein